MPDRVGLGAAVQGDDERALVGVAAAFGAG